jgi:hypothetical protein
MKRADHSVSAAPVYDTPSTTNSTACYDCNPVLWNATGPLVWDVRQGKLLGQAIRPLADLSVTYDDCWWKAVQVAVLHVNQTYIKNLFLDPTNNFRSFDQPQPEASLTAVRLYNPFTYNPEDWYADLRWREPVDDHGDTHGFWWPDAMTQAMRKSSFQHNLSGIDKSTKALTGIRTRIDTALSVLTGKPSYANYFTDYNNPDDLWSIFENSTKTPMIFVTPDQWLISGIHSDPKIADSHAYPIMNTYVNQTTGVKMVSTRNVWGRTDNFTMDDVWANGFQFVHLRDWDEI